MSAETLSRLMERTTDRLFAAGTADERRAVGLVQMSKLAADLGETLFLRIRSLPDLTAAQTNGMIVEVMDRLVGSVIDSFTNVGVFDVDLCEAHCLAARDGFLDRLEALFAIPTTGGRA